MEAIYLKIAAEKAKNDAQRDALRELEPFVLALEQHEATIVDRINESKQRRGEGLTRLRKGEKEELDAYAQDAMEISDEIAEMAKQMDSAYEVVKIFLGPLKADIEYDEGTLKYYHPMERPLGEEGIEIKKRLFHALKNFVNECGND